MTNVLDSAIARRAAAQAEIERLDAFIRMYRELAGTARQEPAPSPASKSGITAKPLTENSGALRETEARVVELIRLNGNTPIPTRSLFDILKSSGFEVGGKDGIATLSARLSRSKTLENHKPFGWRIKEASDEIVSEEPATMPASSENDLSPAARPIEEAAKGLI